MPVRSLLGSSKKRSVRRASSVNTKRALINAHAVERELAARFPWERYVIVTFIMCMIIIGWVHVMRREVSRAWENDETGFISLIHSPMEDLDRRLSQASSLIRYEANMLHRESASWLDATVSSTTPTLISSTSTSSTFSQMSTTTFATSTL